MCRRAEEPQPRTVGAPLRHAAALAWGNLRGCVTIASRIRCRSIRTCGRLVHPELVHGSKCGRSLRFEVLPAIEVGHGRWLGKACRETLECKCIEHEAAKLYAGRRKEQLDLAQCDVMLLHMKQEVTTFTHREEVIPVDHRFQHRSVLGRHHFLTTTPNILWNRPIAAIGDQPARCDDALAGQFAVETNQHDAAWM